MKKHQSTFIGLFPFIFWGFYPVYFKLMKDFSPFEIAAHRIIWTALILVPFFLFIKKNKEGLDRILSEWKYWFMAAIFICTNWFIYSYSILIDQVQQASLAYFVAPIFNLGLASFILKEKMNGGQKIAVFFLIISLLNEATLLNEFPWIAAVIAITFTGFSFAHKKLTLSSSTTLTMEMISLLPIGAVILGHSYMTNNTPLLTGGYKSWLVAFGAGLVTTIPFLVFNRAAQIIPLSKIAIIQYISPTLMFLQAKYLYNENLSQTRILSFGIVWLGIAAMITYNIFSKINFFELKFVKNYILKRKYYF